MTSFCLFFSPINKANKPKSTVSSKAGISVGAIARTEPKNKSTASGSSENNGKRFPNLRCSYGCNESC